MEIKENTHNIINDNIKDNIYENKVEECIKRINDITNKITNKEINKELVKEYKKNLEKFIGQTHLLDPYLKSILSKLYSLIDNENIIEIIYEICKIRQVKNIIKFLDHNENMFDKVINHIHITDNWMEKYCYIIWFIHLLTVPYLITQSIHQSFIDIITNLINTTPNAYHDLIPLLCSSYFSRTDSSLNYILFYQYCKNTLIHNKNENIVSITLRTLSYFFKTIERQHLFTFIDHNLLNTIDSLQFSHSFKIRLNFIKFIQRMCIAYLFPKNTAKLYYEKGEFLNDDTLSKCYNSEIVNKIINIMLNMLFDSNFSVRYSCSKGLSRVSLLLSPKSIHDIIIKSLESFNNTTSKNSQGICLLLAELANKGLINHELIPRVITFLINSLNFPERSYNIVADASVRDSACYLLWGLARAFKPQLLLEYISDLVDELILVALFDPQIICRRAAAATLQELIGRQGNYEHGIDIITVINYNTVKNVTKSYLIYCIEVSNYGDIYKKIINNLIKYRLTSIHKHIKKLASETLQLLATKYPNYFANIILPTLCADFIKDKSIDKLYGIVSILNGIDISNYSNINEYSELFDQIIHIVLNFNQFQFYTPCSLQDKIILQLFCIEMLSSNRLFNNCDEIDVFFDIICKNLFNITPIKRQAAFKALRSFVNNKQLSDHISQLIQKFYEKNQNKINSKTISDKIGIYLFLCSTWRYFVQYHFQIIKNISQFIFDVNIAYHCDIVITHINLLSNVLCVTDINDGYKEVLNEILSKISLLITCFISDTIGDSTKKLRIACLNDIYSILNVYKYCTLDFYRFIGIVQSIIRTIFERDLQVKIVAVESLMKIINDKQLTLSLSKLVDFDDEYQNMVNEQYFQSLNNVQIDILKFFNYHIFQKPLLLGQLSCYNSTEKLTTIKNFKLLINNNSIIGILHDILLNNSDDIRIINGMVYFISLILLTQPSLLFNQNDKSFIQLYYNYLQNHFSSSNSITDIIHILKGILILGYSCQFIRSDVQILVDLSLKHQYPKIQQETINLLQIQHLQIDLFD